MDSPRLTRRSFVVGSVASAVTIGAAVDMASKASAAAPGDLVVGRFVSMQEARHGVITTASGRSIPVTLDSDAFVTHGTDGIVDSLSRFVPGEEVVVRGKAMGRGITAAELQSVYTSVSGTVLADGAAYVLVTASDVRVRVPREVVLRDIPSGVRRGAAYSATIWTDPDTGGAAALDLNAEG